MPLNSFWATNKWVQLMRLAQSKAFCVAVARYFTKLYLGNQFVLFCFEFERPWSLFCINSKRSSLNGLKLHAENHICFALPSSAIVLLLGHAFCFSSNGLLEAHCRLYRSNCFAIPLPNCILFCFSMLLIWN